MGFYVRFVFPRAQPEHLVIFKGLTTSACFFNHGYESHFNFPGATGALPAPGAQLLFLHKFYHLSQRTLVLVASYNPYCVVLILNQKT